MTAEDEAMDAARVDVAAWLATDPANAWVMLTEAEHLRRWWWPQFDDARYEIDAREGGSYRFTTAEGGFGVQGRYLEVVEGERIVQGWEWLGGDEMAQAQVQVVTIALSEHDGGTLVRVLQTAPADEVESLEQGWSDTLTRLEELVDEEA